MKTPLKMMLLAVGSMALFANTSWADIAVKVLEAKVDRSATAMKSPTIQAQTTDMRFRPKDWAYFEAKIKVDARDSATRRPPLFLDNLKVKFYIAVKTPKAERPTGMLLLTKEITYVNVPVNEDFYACVFLSPSSVKRLTGGDTVTSTMVERVGVSISYNDEVKWPEKRGSKKEWWESERLTESSTYPLLDKNHTPFMMLWYDRYPEILDESNSSSSSSGTSSSSSSEASSTTPSETRNGTRSRSRSSRTSRTGE